MKTVVFDMPYPKDKTKFNQRYSLNSYIGGKHWTVSNAAIRDWHTVTISCLKKHRIRKDPFKGPVRITFLWDDRLDIDNHAIIGKATVDAMKGWVLVNDSPKWFRSVTHEFWRGGCIRCIVQEAGD